MRHARQASRWHVLGLSSCGQRRSQSRRRSALRGSNIAGKGERTRAARMQETKLVSREARRSCKMRGCGPRRSERSFEPHSVHLAQTFGAEADFGARDPKKLLKVGARQKQMWPEISPCAAMFGKVFQEPCSSGSPWANDLHLLPKSRRTDPPSMKRTTNR